MLATRHSPRARGDRCGPCRSAMAPATCSLRNSPRTRPATQLLPASPQRFRQLTDDVLRLKVKSWVAVSHRQNPEPGQGGIATKVTFPLPGRAVICRAVHLDVDHLLVVVAIEIDATGRQVNRHLTTRDRQAAVGEDVLVPPQLELAVASAGHELNHRSELPRAGCL